MSRVAGNLLCILVGALLGGFGGLLVLVCWPLLFPLSLRGSSTGENAVAIAFFAFSLSFAVLGFLLCRRLTQKICPRDFLECSDGAFSLGSIQSSWAPFDILQEGLWKSFVSRFRLRPAVLLTVPAARMEPIRSMRGTFQRGPAFITAL
jgi:hypothetical protein